MPPKRKAANTKVESTTKAEANLPLNDQTDPPANKSKKKPLPPKEAQVTKKVAASSKDKPVEKPKTRSQNKNEADIPVNSGSIPPEDKITKRKIKDRAEKPESNPADEPKAKKRNKDKAETTEKSDLNPADEPKAKKRNKDKAETTEKSDLKKPTDEAKSKRKNKDNAEKPEKSAPSNSTTTNWDKMNFTCTKKNALGQKHNLKISCWNIGGLKSWVKKDCLKFLEYEDPDILCVQETKCSEQKLPDEIKAIKGYKQYWCASDKEGYAGVGLLTKSEPLKVNFGINVPELDEDGRCITAEYKNYYIVCVYVPNAGRKLVTLPKRLEWNTAFQSYIKSLDEKKPVIICGDMNVAHNEIDLARPASNTKNAGFTKEEREGMSDFLEDGYKDTFRELYPDRADAYTFWTYMANARAKNVGWRLDYFIVSEKLLGNVCDNVMRSEVMGSDHCPITLFINI